LAWNEEQGGSGGVAGGGIVHPDLAQVGEMLLKCVGNEVIGPIVCFIPLGHGSSIVLRSLTAPAVVFARSVVVPIDGAGVSISSWRVCIRSTYRFREAQEQWARAG
jgi:hypothetical protein